MGYPMTFRRLVNRSRLDGLDYGAEIVNYNTDPFPGAEKFNEGVDMEKVLRSHIDSLYGGFKEANGRWSMLCGDLKRLRQDAVDEGAICAYIAGRTGIDKEVVAAVLKEFVEW